MTVATLARAIRHLPAREQARLFSRIGPSLEDYFLAKIAHDRSRRAPRRRVSWDALRP